MNAAMSISPQVMLFQPVWTWRMRLPYPPFLPNQPLPRVPAPDVSTPSHTQTIPCDPQPSLFSSSYGFLGHRRLSPIFLPSFFPGPPSVNSTRRYLRAQPTGTERPTSTPTLSVIAPGPNQIVNPKHTKEKSLASGRCLRSIAGLMDGTRNQSLRPKV